MEKFKKFCKIIWDTLVLQWQSLFDKELQIGDIVMFSAYSRNYIGIVLSIKGNSVKIQYIGPKDSITAWVEIFYVKRVKNDKTL
jgi:hypothetical protein